MVFFRIVSILFFTNNFASDIPVLYERIESCMIAAAWGDVLGGMTEFDASMDVMFAKHPQGVLSINDFTSHDWMKFPESYRLLNVGPYTDDTAMALVLADVLLQQNAIGSEYKKGFRNRKKILDAQLQSDAFKAVVADAFIKDMHNPYGWSFAPRAPGTSTIKALTRLELVACKNWHTIYQSFKNNGGCGSVMRAYPCGLVYATKHPSKHVSMVARTAADQSMVTHGHVWAISASVGLAEGVAALVYNESENPDVNDCIDVINDAVFQYEGTMHEVSVKIAKARSYGLSMRALLLQLQVDTPQKLITELKNNNSPITKLHVKVCAEFPGWRADDAIAAAVYASLASTTVPYLGIVLGVHSTGDSDSIASIAGALLGACYGKQALIPQVWDQEVSHIEGIDTIKAYAQKIYAYNRD